MHPPLPTRPEMSLQEASWHEHLAGMRATDAARTQGEDPAAIHALATATAGAITIGHHTLRPASQGTIWTLQRLAREWAAYAAAHAIPASGDPTAPGTREIIELGLSTLAFCDARTCWQALDRGDLPALITRAEALMWDTPLAEQLALQAHFTAQMDQLKAFTPQEEDTPPGKPMPPAPPATGSSPASQIPPPATPSPPSNG
jgi:hypothetical protein